MDRPMITKEIKNEREVNLDQGKKAKIKKLQNGKTPGNSTAC